MKLLGLIALLWFLWEPLRPIRTVTGEALSTTAEIIRR